MYGKAITVPIVEPMFAKATTIKILVTLFFGRADSLLIWGNSSKSETLGDLILSSTRPANHPAAKAGCKEVNGAAKNAVKIDKGWALARAAPKADKVPLMTNQNSTRFKAIALPFV